MGVFTSWVVFHTCHRCALLCDHHTPASREAPRRVCLHSGTPRSQSAGLRGRFVRDIRPRAWRYILLPAGCHEREVFAIDSILL